MNIEDILSEIDAEIARLQQAKVLLGSSTPGTAVSVKRKPGRPPAAAKAFLALPVAKKSSKRRTMSPEGRAKIAAAQKARWAKSKKAAKSVTKKKVGRPAKSTAKKSAPAKKNVAAKSETTASQA